METKVMKIMWTIAALAGSVTLVSAQQSPRAPQPATAPTPAPKVRIRTPEPLLAPLPGVDLILDLPSPVAFIAPVLWDIVPLPPLEPPMALPPLEFDLPSLAIKPGQAPIPFEFQSWTPLPGVAPLALFAPTAPLTPVPSEPMIFDLLPGQGPVTPRPPRQDREVEAELRRLLNELDRAERERQRAVTAQEREATREAEALVRSLQREIEQSERER